MTIDRNEAQKHGVQIIESENALFNKQQEKIEAIKKILPNIINADNKLDTEQLEELIGLTNTTYKQQGYELTFAGKGIARAKATEETNLELTLQQNQCKNADNTQNVVIKGDNLEALKILNKNYANKIKMIYIDPPYNTGNDGFVYNDNFKQTEQDLIENYNLNEETINYLSSIYKTQKHSAWLAFMYPRLKLAQELLKEDGVIFISIDDNEQANLKILCDEIFGEENFVANIVWECRNPNVDIISTDHEYCLVYCKNKATINPIYKKIKRKYIFKDNYNWLGREIKRDYPLQDEHGSYRLGSLEVTTEKQLSYSYLIDPIQRKVIPATKQEVLSADKTKYVANYLYSNAPTTMQERLDNVNEIVFEKNEKQEWLARVKTYKKDDMGYSALVSVIKRDSVKYSDSNNDIKELGINFDYAKPKNFIKTFISASTTQDDIVLDFFAGSGTTGHAVMQLNAQDGGNRKFILVQLDEPIQEKQEAYKFCIENNFKPVISSITIERLNRAGNAIIQNNQQAKQTDQKDLTNLDIGYKVFALQPKPILQNNNGAYQLFNNYNVDIDCVYNMLVKTDVELHNKIEQLSNAIYKVANNCYVIQNITEDDKKILSTITNNYIYINGFADINLENFLNLLNLNNTTKENIKIVY